MPKRRNDDKKPREAVVNISIDAGDEVEMLYNEAEQTATITVRREGKKVSARAIDYYTYYERSNRPKYINALYFRRSKHFTVSHEEAISRFHHVWAIDTNRRSLFGKTVNVSVCSVCQFDEPEPAAPVSALCFGETKGNPELFAWRHYINILSKQREYDSTREYALIVDSEFTEIELFNRRVKAIHNDYLLPENWHLIYATSDKPGDSLLNRALSVSDRKASAIIEWIGRVPANEKHFSPVINEEAPAVILLPLRPRGDSTTTN